MCACGFPALQMRQFCLFTNPYANIKMSFIWKDDFFSKIGIFCKSIAGLLPRVVQAYTQPYKFGGRIKLIICQIRHELSVTIHKIGIHIHWPLQPFSQDYWPSFSHHLCCVCVNFIHKWRQIFLRNFSYQFYLLSEFLPEICWAEIAEEILSVFCFDVWTGARTLAFRLISQHTTYQITVTSMK